MKYLHSGKCKICGNNSRGVEVGLLDGQHLIICSKCLSKAISLMANTGDPKTQEGDKQAKTLAPSKVLAEEI